MSYCEHFNRHFQDLAQSEWSQTHPAKEWKLGQEHLWGTNSKAKEVFWDGEGMSE